MPATDTIACSLDRTELSGRAELMARLGDALVAVEADGTQAVLRFESGREALDDFIRAESECCPFFDFALDAEPASTTLRINVPEGGEWAVRGLVAGFVARWGGLV
jgi:hypothetical protein